MTIIKFGHCCLLVEEGTTRILIDPGTYSTSQNSIKDIDAILITHEHQDHLLVDSLMAVLQNNPQAKVITNKGVGSLLAKENIPCVFVEHGQHIEEKGVLIEGFGNDHALMHSSIPPIPNTGYFIANRLFYPGDAFTNPGKQTEILALPVAGPWMKISEAIDYALELKPKICFPVHEGLKALGSVHRIPLQVLAPKGIKFIVLELDKEYEF